MQQTVPAHVPPHLVTAFDYHDQPGDGPDPHAAWMRLQDGPDIIWSPEHGGHWILTRGAPIRDALTRHEVFSSRQASIPATPRPFRLSPIEQDPPDHPRIKAMSIGEFAPARIQLMADEIRAHSHALIDGFIDRGACEFVNDYALRLPIDMFMRMAGLPGEDRDMLLGLMHDKMHVPSMEKQAEAARALVAYSRKMLEIRLATPGDDLISAIIAEGRQREATRDELLGYIFLLWTAGLDTVSSSMGFMARFLAEHAGHRRQLVAEPALIPNAVQELLRRFGVSTPSRILAQDVEFHGVPMRTGDMVLVPVSLYGLDERVFPNPLEVDFRRGDAAMSMVFGTGIHRCIGSFLARLELRIFLETWLERIPEFRIGEGSLPRGRAGVINSMLHLPLAWD